MRIGVLGAGSLGSLFAGRIADTGTAVSVLGRANEHLDTIRESGITVRTPGGEERTVDVEASSDPSILAGVDAVLVCVKSYDTDQSLAVVEDHLSPDTDVVTLQNGLGNAETIATHVPDPKIVAGTTTHGATLEGPGVVRHAGGGETRIGRYYVSNDESVESLAATFTDAGIETAVVSNVRDAIWEKVLVNVGINAATALARVPTGELLEGPGHRLLQSAIQEGVRIASADGRELPDDIVERALAVAEATASNRTSMLQDLEAGKRTEIEALNGELVRRADHLGVRAPVNRTLTDLVRLAEDR